MVNEIRLPFGPAKAGRMSHRPNPNQRDCLKDEHLESALREFSAGRACVFGGYGILLRIQQISGSEQSS